jgi:hypothetical protein
MERRERLGCLVTPGNPSLQKLPLVGFLFGAKDTWWSFSSDHAHTARQLRLAASAFVERGIPWFSACGL